MYLIKVILVFFIIFNFPIPVIYNSAFLALSIATCFYFAQPSLIKDLRSCFGNKYIVSLLGVFLLLMLIGFIPGILHFTFDFTIIKPYLLNIILLFIAIYIYPLLIKEISLGERFYYILNLLISVFFLQSVIEVTAFLSPVAKDFVAFFQKDLVSEKDMGGIRALALTGNPFFDLAASFGLIFIVFTFSISVNKNGNKYFSLRNSLFFIVLFVGSFFAGRTAFVGLGTALALYFLSFGSRFKKLISFIRLILIVAGTSFLLYNILLPPETKDMVENQLLPFAFEVVYNYIDTGETSTKSGEVLEQMYFPLSWQTFLFGDGIYTGEDGAYYMHTDSGIMRNILFYGIFGLLLILIGHLFYFFKPLMLIFSDLKKEGSFATLNTLLFFLGLLLYTVILQYKGEVLLFMPIIQVMLFYICFSFLERSKEI
ncbi:hypothetical protein [Sphingobacterium sp. UME9]|uniref:hypothetical protein n=1 Tax=Sphingobacterium sp. UME9 TaxID=1862316 RepID=UPI0015FEBEB7|nr:hypothetical protein [Sphingobacterium sp. UME9]MBB1645534.1 hypothetical protein [Sphingobacterium sp. UME9]